MLMNRSRAEPRARNGETANDRARIILIGHSLGAAVCLHVARRYPVDLLVMLACPTFWPDFEPDPPPHSGLSDAALERAAEFLKRVCASSVRVRAPAVHFVGLQDRWVPASQARRLPVPLVVVPGAGHGLVRSALFRRLLIRRLLPRG